MNAPQGSDAWRLDRCGRATASCFAAVLAKGEGKTRAKYLLTLLAERMTGKPIETYHNGHMDRGLEQEDAARQAYEDVSGNWAVKVGFLAHPTLMAGCSPDALVNDNAGAEIKCVIPTVQITTIMYEKCPPEHKAQIQGNLWITEREYWDFCSYSPELPANLRLFVYRVNRDEPYIQNLGAEVKRFLDELDHLHSKLLVRGIDLPDSIALGTQP